MPEASDIPLTPEERRDRDGSLDPALVGSARSERLALAWLAGGAVLVIVRIVMPVGLGMLLGALTAFCLEPLHRRLAARTGRPKVSAIVIVATTGLAVLGTFAGLAWLFVTKGVSFGTRVVAAFGPEGAGTALVTASTRELQRFGVNHDMLIERLRDAAADATNHAAAAAGAIATLAGEGLLGLFFLLLTLHLFLGAWDKTLARAEAVLPLRPDYTHALFEEFRKVGRATLQGTLLTGIAQGVLAAIGFAISGVGEAVFFGAATAVASLIPAVGTLLVWVPVGIYLVMTGHAVAGVFLLVWGLVVVVGVSDYVIRPRAIGGDDKTPELFTFAALLGGVEAFGLQGLIVGPLLTSLALAVLRIYGNEAVSRRRAALASR
jgi:predicted PurR-regulated permease PerM